MISKDRIQIINCNIALFYSHGIRTFVLKELDRINSDWIKDLSEYEWEGKEKCYCMNCIMNTEMKTQKMVMIYI